MLQVFVDVGGQLVLAAARVAIALQQHLVSDRCVVEVDREEHVVAREQEILEGEHRAVLQRQVHAAVALHRFQVLHQPVEVELPVVHSGEEGIALQVVHPVGVQLAADDLPQDGEQVAARAAERVAARRRAPADEGGDVRWLEGAAPQLRLQAGVEH